MTGILASLVVGLLSVDHTKDVERDLHLVGLLKVVHTREGERGQVRSGSPEC